MKISNEALHENDSMDRPNVSVIIPVYNRANVIHRAIESVINQTGVETEIIVVDDGSKDNIRSAIYKYRGQVRFFSKINGGVSSARNFGMSKARGRLLAFLDSDDMYKEGKLEKAIDVLNNSPNADFLFTDFERFKIDDINEIFEHNNSYFFSNVYKFTNIKIETKKSRAFYLEQSDVFDLLLMGYFMSPCTLVMRREVLESGIVWPEEFKLAEDFLFFLLLSAKHSAVYIDEPLTLVGRGDKNLSSEMLACAYADINVLRACMVNHNYFTVDQRVILKRAFSDRSQKLGWNLKTRRRYKEALWPYLESYFHDLGNFKSIANFFWCAFRVPFSGFDKEN